MGVIVASCGWSPPGAKPAGVIRGWDGRWYSAYSRSPGATTSADSVEKIDAFWDFVRSGCR
ncbi:MAG: hypothetical protein AABY08_01375, partial [Candidatus Thermoplasmatota archaeon]